MDNMGLLHAVSGTRKKDGSVNFKVAPEFGFFYHDRAYFTGPLQGLNNSEVRNDPKVIDLRMNVALLTNLSGETDNSSSALKKAIDHHPHRSKVQMQHLFVVLSESRDLAAIRNSMFDFSILSPDPGQIAFNEHLYDPGSDRMYFIEELDRSKYDLSQMLDERFSMYAELQKRLLGTIKH